MVFVVILLTLLAVHVAPSHGQTTTPVPFVSGPVKCTSVAVQFAVDPNNLSFKKLNDYTGFVGVFADHADPKCADVPVSIMTSLGGDYEISISFSDCNISIAALYGAQQRLLEYSATIHARLSPIDFLGAGSYSLNASYANLTFPITCNWKTGALVSNNATITK
uniref:Uncharacterized protein n=1 Tax=Plectus sambesii TaxID=2011161 RepID=A0A914VNY8_9BILA